MLSSSLALSLSLARCESSFFKLQWCQVLCLFYWFVRVCTGCCCCCIIFSLLQHCSVVVMNIANQSMQIFLCCFWFGLYSVLFCALSVSICFVCECECDICFGFGLSLRQKLEGNYLSMSISKMVYTEQHTNSCKKKNTLRKKGQWEKVWANKIEGKHGKNKYNTSWRKHTHTPSNSRALIITQHYCW